MMDYDFTLRYQLPDNDRDFDQLIERLAEAGCADALAGIGLPGRVALAFTREATSAEVALMTALADVHTGIPKAQLIEVAPDFVGLTDVAEAIGVTRQNMRKLMVSHAATFPVPVHEGATSLWHLADVLSWLREKGNYTWAEGLLDVALVAKQINLALASRQLQSRMQRRIAELVD